MYFEVNVMDVVSYFDGTGYGLMLLYIYLMNESQYYIGLILKTSFYLNLNF